MAAVYRSLGADVQLLERAQISRSSKLIQSVRNLVTSDPPNAAMIWHGLPKLPQLLFALKDLGIMIGVHGGNPAHTMPRWVDWKFVLLGLRYPTPKPTYICPSQYVADSFETSRYLRVLPRVVIYNGVELPRINSHTPRVFDSTQPFIIGMLARLDLMKDHATLLRAFAIVNKSLPNVRLELAGGGNQLEPLQALATELGIVEFVKFHGDVSDVYGVMSRWDILAYATTKREGLGVALIEGMMIGLPVVATDIGPIREVCGRPGSGMLVPAHDANAFAEALLKLIPDTEARTTLSQVGRCTALERFHPTVFARKHAELFGLPYEGAL